MNTKRKQILDAAHQLFVEKGFSTTSIQDILDKAGIAKGTFYNYFDSKNACLRAILQSVTEEIDQKRRELALNTEKSREDIFIKQVAVRIDMNRQHHLLTMFETVSFFDDAELKSFMERQYRSEMHWIAKRLGDLYPPEAIAYRLDHAVILMGTIHHMLHIWKLGSKEEIDSEKVIQYGLRQIKLLVENQSDNTPFLPDNWLGLSDSSSLTESHRIIGLLKEINEKTTKNSPKKQTELISFLIEELQEANPRIYVLESVIRSLEDIYEGHDVREIIESIKQYISSLENNES
ncbi:TetR/AcrR family transcriptional regulator [Sediminibacillus massiliensis]|uniref:TetR/AcrR family transcriptional regulator n=1 Tax=Sediminibacillus massiliensis TaxID=1926277 RepID=UPI0009883B5B|nr:TetR/AcrR family transcriptional regulator [Sediminibacillus massiliensis]